MKHAIGVANLNAFLFAMRAAGIDEDTGAKVAGLAGTAARKLLLGKSVYGHKLSDFQADADTYEEFHRAHPEALIEAHNHD